ncbi:MAG: hypothetical protein AABW48_01845 [Nanoarchaeota archaeon]
MSEIRYLCAGNCRTMVSIKEFKEGKRTCPVESCTKYNQSLERGEYCSHCNTCFEEGEDHICI